MKKIVIASTKVVVILMLTVIISSRIQAQPNPGPGNSGSTITLTSDGPTVPFDGGRSLMLAASGIGYVSKKLKRK
jgi:hypothetical protein